MAEEDGDKTVDPTPHRRQQAREEGHVVFSQDLASAALLIASLMTLMYLGTTLADQLGKVLHTYLGGEAWLQADSDVVMSHWYANLYGLAGPLLGLLGTILLIAVLLHVGQTGLLFLPDKLMPDISRLDPLAGFGRIFSLPSFARLAFGIFKILAVATVAVMAFYNKRDEILALTGLELPQIALATWELSLWTCIKVGAVLLVLAILDYAFQRWKHEQDLKMTPQEVREEMKNLQGNPEVISRRRSVQRQLAMHRLSSAVPKADVVITNPTELAVAIQYEADTMAAPIVVAKGAGVVAQRIRRLALENGIPIVEKKPLAQALYKEVDINHPIPDKMYAGVAEVLAYVYQLKGKSMPAA